MEVHLLVEQGASKKDESLVLKFKKRLENPKGENIFLIMDEIRKHFPDSWYSGFNVVLCVPTAIDLSPRPGKNVSTDTLRMAIKELGWD